MKLLQEFRSAPFRNKLLVSYILLALVPLILFSVLGGTVFLSRTQRATVDNTKRLVRQISNSIDLYVGSTARLADYITLELERTDLLDPACRDEKTVAEFERTLQNVAASHPEIAGILVAGKDDFLVSTGMSRVSRDPFSDEYWYQMAARKVEKPVLISNAVGRNIVTNKQYSVDEVFSMARAVTGPTGAVDGVVLMDVRHDIIQNSISEATIGQDGFVFVLDSEENVVYTPPNPVVYRVDPAWLKNNPSQTLAADIGGRGYQICYTQSAVTGWKTVGVFPLDEVMGSINMLAAILAVAVLFTGAVVLVVAFRTANSVTHPISKLRKLMKQAESGDLSVRFASRYDDEIGDLGRSFNHMIEQIDRLVHRVYEEQKNKRDAEMKILQEQIKPHFLYNTLDTISWMAREYEAEDIVRLVDALTNMFRVGLSRGKDLIPVSSEMQHVSNYLYIQKIRYKDRLQYRIDVDETLSDCIVPKLILQPLVENAIYHGIKRKRSGGTICVTGRWTADGYVEFTVADDGAGIQPDTLAMLRERLEGPYTDENKKSFGLPYIAQRIRLYYGEQGRVELDGKPEQGARVRITLPPQPPPGRTGEDEDV